MEPSIPSIKEVLIRVEGDVVSVGEDIDEPDETHNKSATLEGLFENKPLSASTPPTRKAVAAIGSTNSSGINKNIDSKKRPFTNISEEMSKYADDSASSCSDASQKMGFAKKGKDLGQSYAEVQKERILFMQKELDFKEKQSEREFQWKSEQYAKEMQLKEAEMDIKRNESSNNRLTTIIKTMMEQGKTAREINEYLGELQYIR